MQEKINIKQALRVFQVIITDGKHANGEHHLNGLSANSGYDGYSVTIHNDYVSLSIHFHNSMNFEYTSLREKELFMEKLELIDRKYT